MLQQFFEKKIVFGSPRENFGAGTKLLKITVFTRIKKIFGEFDPGSGRTLAASLTHASRTRKHLRVLVKWRTGE